MKTNLILTSCYNIKVIFFFITIINLNIEAQLPPLPVIQTPNASSLGTFGNIPVSLYTGMPNISIPLHTIAVGSIRVPIELKYHPSTVKPSMHAGWVGFGWHLQSYGSISRVMNTAYDEDDFIGDFRSYYPNPGNPGKNYFGSQMLDIPDWNSKSNLREYLYKNNTYCDVSADEFNFNFLGYTGKFYYTSKGWVAICDQNIKIELGVDGKQFITKLELQQYMNTIFSKYNDASENACFSYESQPRFFYGFTITAENGTKYIFGGDGALEIGTYYYNLCAQYFINNWYLKKIIDACGNEVNFTYHSKYPIVNLGYYCNIDQFNCVRQGLSYLGIYLGDDIYKYSTPGPVTTNDRFGKLIWQLYLTEITTSKNEKVSFSTSISNELQYPHTFLVCQRYPGTVVNLSDYRRIGYNVQNLKWEKLDSIRVKQDNTTIFGYNFYHNSVTTKRLMLDSLNVTSNSGKKGGVYKFEYNAIPDSFIYGGNMTDHWGCFNGKDVRGVAVNNFLQYKETDTALVKMGLIRKLIYPTGGYTEFDWEAHKYGRIVRKSRSLLDFSTGYAGGCRIKEIRDYPSSSSAPIKKKYYYLLNYSNSANLNTLTSSGVLNGIPEYSFSDTDGRLCDISEDPCTITFDFFSTNGFSSYNGPHIGYENVIEKTEDGSYTIFGYYSNWYDRKGTYIGWIDGEDTYMPYASMESERGLQSSIRLFKNDDSKVKETYFFYRSDIERFNDNIRRVEYRNSLNCGANKIIFASAFHEYKYRFNLTSKHIYNYFDNGQIKTQEYISYEYNQYDQIKSERFINSKQQDIVTNYKYPLDYSGISTLAEINALKQNHIIDPVIEKVSYYNSSTPLVNKAEFTEFKQFYNNVIKPGKIYQLNSINQFFPSFFSKKYSSGEDERFLLVEECCARTQTETFTLNNGHKGEITMSLLLIFPYFESGHYDLSLTGPSYNFNKSYYPQTDNDTLKITEYGLLNQGTYNLTLSYTTNSGHSDDAMQGECNAKIFYYNPYDTIYNTDLRQVASLNYNNEGNIIESQKTDDNKISYFWAYNQTYPVVKAENISNDELTAKIISAAGKALLNTTSWIFDPIAEKQKWWRFNTFLREYCGKNVMITTYTFKPLVGVTSQTDPNGITTYYEYDTFGRLKYTKDDDGRILQNYQYNYKH